MTFHPTAAVFRSPDGCRAYVEMVLERRPFNHHLTPRERQTIYVLKRLAIQLERRDAAETF